MKKLITIFLFLGALYTIYQATRIGMGCAILVACLWYFIFAQMHRPKKMKVMHDRAERAARSQSDLIQNK